MQKTYRVVRKILQNFRRIDKNKRISGDFGNSNISLSIALLGSTSNFSSIPAKGNEFLQLHVRLSALRLRKKAQALCSAIPGEDRVVCSGYSSHFVGYQVCSIKIITRGC